MRGVLEHSRRGIDLRRSRGGSHLRFVDVGQGLNQVIRLLLQLGLRLLLLQLWCERWVVRGLDMLWLRAGLLWQLLVVLL